MPYLEVEVDLTIMIDTNNKLVNGCQVDLKIINILLLVCQSQGIDDLEDKTNPE